MIMPNDNQIERYRRDVCFGDDVECGINNVIQLIAEHLNHNHPDRFKNSLIHNITQSHRENSNEQDEMMFAIYHPTIEFIIKQIIERA